MHSYSSDVDITVLNAFYTRGREPLYALAYELRRRRMSKRLETVGKARVPIIKLTDAGNAQICLQHNSLLYSITGWSNVCFSVRLSGGY